MQDLEKIIKIQNGNTKFFGDIYDKYVEKIYKFIYLKTSNKEIAEDLTSETFISALQSIASFDTSYEKGNLKSWIYKIAYNKVINYYKLQGREIDITDGLDLAYNIDFGKNIDDKDKLTEVFSFLETLKPREKNIILYRIWYDLSFAEISNILGISVDNCKQISSRAMKKISANFLAILLFILIIL